MGFIGGAPAYWFLKRFFPGGVDPTENFYEKTGTGKLLFCFGPDIFASLRDKQVIDFGCGEGLNTIDLALNGCRHVIGLDIQEDMMSKARAAAERSGVADTCRFVTSWESPVDVILSTDAFEHFSDPAFILREMRRLLKDDGYILVEFGYTWHHPYGGHLFAVFPWAHLMFTEKALIRWRSDFRSDGAKRFHEVAGGLNQMTLKRWERLVEASDFRFERYELVPIRAARWLHNRITREFLTSSIRARLVPKRKLAT
jgi:SAM-dependent methyltransferase